MKFYTRLLLLLFVFSASAYTAKGLTASFKADVTSGCSPLVVHFTNTSTGATSYYWDLGNGTTTALTDASTSYTSPGTYTVTLTATGGGTSKTYTMTITVYPAPTVNFYASDTAVCPGAPITFTSTTISGVPGTITLTWDFGDGTVVSGASPTHAYTSPGYYNVTLSATNSKGCVATLLLARYIHIFTPANISITASSTYFCKAPGADLFTNLTTGVPVLTYAWSFGDGGTSALTNPPHTYLSPGTYTVSLTVTDGNGCIDSAVWPAYIFVSGLKASFIAPATTCINSKTLFTNTSTAHVSSNWAFGDGGTDTANNGTHIYTTAGTYTVTLVVFDGSCYDTATNTITVTPGPIASFTQTPLEPCPPPVPITFTATVPVGSTVKWLYSDGGTGSGITATHTFGHRGIDTIRMVVTDPATGCTDTTVRIDTLYDLTLSSKAVPKSGCEPLTVAFTTGAQTHEPDTTKIYPYPFGVASYTWDFGDGSATAIGGGLSHTYIAVGTYYAIVTALTNNGCVLTDTLKILVGSPPVVTATVTPTHICFSKSVTFVITVVSGPITNFSWEFGDGSGVYTDSVLIDGHLYIDPGVFTATVTPYYNGCPGPSFVVPTPITVDSPKARISASYNCSPRTRVDFTDISYGDDTHMWLFGDGTTSTLANPIHDYPLPTIYTVMLTTYNIRSGCRDTTTSLVDLTKPTIDFTPDHYAVCKDSIIHFTPLVASGKATFYKWYVNGKYIYDTGYVNILTNVLTDTFFSTGIDTIMLIMIDQLGCFDTVVKTVTIAFPAVNFTVSPSSGCWPLTAIFTDHSTDVPGVTFPDYEWSFGDGGTASVAIPSTAHTYVTAGSFSIQEIVTDNVGCKDSLTLPLVTVYRPSASFFATNNYPCIGDSVYFSNTSVGITSSMWFFGDGTTDTTNSAWHVYTSTGIYTVKLVVTDAHGCTDTAVYVSYIIITKPTASFYMSDSFSICPPLTVTFFNTSIGAVGYNWTFGDGGGMSISISPSNLYTKPAYDTVMLIATNSAGCSDTTYGHVTIYGYAGAFTYNPIKGCAPLTVNFKAALSNVPNIVWDFSDGTTSATSYSDTMTHIYVLPGEYLPKLILSDNTGCENSSLGIDTIKVDAVRPGFTTVPSPVCVNTPMNFKDTTGSYFSFADQWLWTFSDGDTSNLKAPTYTYPVVGTYPVTLFVSDAWGCKGTTTENVTVYPPPVITASPDSIICLGDAATLTGYGSVSYTWSPESTVSCTACNPTHASPSVITNYTVTGTDKNGCVNTDTVSVFLKTKTVSVSGGDTAGCFGISAPLFVSGATKFTWIPPNGLNDSTIGDPIAAPDFTTHYTIIAQLGSCIPDTNYITVTVYPIPTVSAGPDQTLLEGSKAQLQATGTDIYTYNWGGAPTLSCNDCQNPVASMSVTTTYVITVTDSFGCPSSDSVTIHLYCDKNQLFLPNCFTPNGDGKDDVFYPRGKGIGIIKSFRIYNRWGQLLFERDNINANDESNAWDGSYNGGTPRPDVYVYVVEAICETGAPINIKGDVTIIR